MLNRNVILYGQESLPPQPIALRAGALTMEFEPDNAFLRYIRWGDEEIARCIYAVARDNNWNTLPWEVKNLRTDARPDSFDITFDVECSDGAIQYAWRGKIAGTAEGKVTFAFDGVAKTDFLRNRIGICVLHPGPAFAGRSCKVEHNDGSVEETQFPQQIAPWQPLRDVLAVTTGLANGAAATVRFEGEVFETEDQRNYGDASFKTYSTPQDLPKPVQVRAGDAVKQVVTVSVDNPQRAAAAAALMSSPARVSAVGRPVPKPAVGLQIGRESSPMTDLELQRTRALELSHLRADIFPGHSGWEAFFKLACGEAKRAGAPLHLALHLGSDFEAELNEVGRAAAALRPEIALWIVYRHGESFPSAETVGAVSRVLSSHGFKGPIAGAASPFFTEFNRNRPGKSEALVCYPLAPQVHLTDRSTLMENLADVSETVRTAFALTGRMAVVSPITLKRAEPKASRTAAPDALPPTVDPRQMSLFAAAWTVGSLAQFCGLDGAHSATYFETVGWRGVMETAEGPPLPGKFFSIPGAVFPVYHVFADLAGVARVRSTQVTRPLDAAAMTLVDSSGRERVIVANLLARQQEVVIGIEKAEARVRRLNAETAEDAMRAPEEFRKRRGEAISAMDGELRLSLSPYEVARIDL